MDLIIDNISALRFWSMEHRSLEACSSPCERRTLKGSSSSSECLDELGIERVGLGKGPVHLLTDRKSRRMPTEAIICHLRTAPLAKGAFRRLGPKLLIASPELSFLEMAGVLPLPKLAEYGCLLCGTYTADYATPCINDRKPLTSKDRLADFIEAMSGTNGCKQARRALRSVTEGAASPYESKLMLLLSMPTKQGGYGFPLPEFNRRIDFSKREQRLYGRPFVVLDLFWPHARVGIEYDGQAYHSSAEDLGRDRRKNSELSCKGITVLRVDREQLATPSSVYVLAQKLARLMGRQLHRPSPQQWRARRLTFAQLMGKTH